MCLPCDKHHLQWWPNVCGKGLGESCKNKDTISFPRIAHGSSKMLSSRWCHPPPKPLRGRAGVVSPSGEWARGGGVRGNEMCLRWHNVRGRASPHTCSATSQAQALCHTPYPCCSPSLGLCRNATPYKVNPNSHWPLACHIFSKSSVSVLLPGLSSSVPFIWVGRKCPLGFHTSLSSSPAHVSLPTEALRTHRP